MAQFFLEYNYTPNNKSMEHQMEFSDSMSKEYGMSYDRASFYEKMGLFNGLIFFSKNAKEITNTNNIPVDKQQEDVVKIKMPLVIDEKKQSDIFFNYPIALNRTDSTMLILDYYFLNRGDNNINTFFKGRFLKKPQQNISTNKEVNINHSQVENASLFETKKLEQSDEFTLDFFNDQLLAATYQKEFSKYNFYGLSSTFSKLFIDIDTFNVINSNKSILQSIVNHGADVKNLSNDRTVEIFPPAALLERLRSGSRRQSAPLLLKDSKSFQIYDPLITVYNKTVEKDMSYFNDLYVYKMYKYGYINQWTSVDAQAAIRGSVFDNPKEISPESKKLIVGQNTALHRNFRTSYFIGQGFGVVSPWKDAVAPDNTSFIIIDNEDTSVLDNSNYLLKLKKKTLKPQDIIFGFNPKREASVFSTTSATQWQKETILYNADSFILRNNIDVSSIKTLQENFYNNTLAVLVPNRKTNLFDRINLYVEKTIKESRNNSHENEFLKLKYKTFLNVTDIWSQLDSKNALLEYTDAVLLKKKIKTSIQNEIDFIKKAEALTIKDTSIYLLKNHKETSIEVNNLFINGSSSNAHYQEDKFLQKVLKDAITQYDVMAQQKEEPCFILYNSYNFGYKNALETKEEQNDYWYDKVEKPTMHMYTYENQLFIEKLPKLLYDTNKGIRYIKGGKPLEMEEEDLTFSKKNNNTFSSEDYTWITKDSMDSSLIVQELARLDKVQKDLEKNAVKDYNWVYVYNYEDGLDPNINSYGIDELLLPQTDVKYEQLEDIIFNKKTMKPRSPIKVIDDHTFIAKYPIKHPVPNYEDVGIEYIDIESSLMYEIYLKFYQIWYSNVFKFGNMDMASSVNLMLDYMHSFILNTYGGGERFEQALRVFRQIRWFAESSIIKNANYLISFNYEDLKSNLQTGSCDIEYTSAYFVIDKSLKVFTINESDYKKDAFINFVTCNAQDTTISFSVSFINGYLEVYINDELVDTITRPSTRYEYEIDGTRTSNHITFKRPAEANVNYCYIGNVIIKNGKYKDLNITYDPDLKKGNMPLNDVVQKMILFANMYDNNEELLEKYKKGNIGVSTLFEKLKEYWELHHANKTKGKRLTIKES